MHELLLQMKKIIIIIEIVVKNHTIFGILKLEEIKRKWSNTL